MHQHVNLNDFRDAFKAMGRGEQFSYDGLGLIFDYLETLETDSEQIELDVTGICREYTEMSIGKIAEAYDISIESCDNDDDDEEALVNAVRSYLERETEVIGETSDGFVFAQF